MRHFSASALVLSRSPYGERDLIVRLFTPDAGRITLMAKSALGSRRRFSGVLEPFHLLSITCRAGKNRLPLLTEAGIIETHGGLRKNALAAACAGCWADMISRTLAEEQPAAGIYVLFRQLLFLAADPAFHSADKLAGLHIAFGLKLLDHLGLRPNLTECRSCRRKFSDIADHRAGLASGAGGAVCAECGGKAGEARGDKGVLGLMNWLLNAEADALGHVSMEFSRFSLMDEFIDGLLTQHIGRPLKSRILAYHFFQDESAKMQRLPALRHPHRRQPGYRR